MTNVAILGKRRKQIWKQIFVSDQGSFIIVVIIIVVIVTVSIIQRSVTAHKVFIVIIIIIRESGTTTGTSSKQCAKKSRSLNGSVNVRMLLLEVITREICFWVFAVFLGNTGLKVVVAVPALNNITCTFWALHNATICIGRAQDGVPQNFDIQGKLLPLPPRDELTFVIAMTARAFKFFRVVGILWLWRSVQKITANFVCDHGLIRETHCDVSLLDTWAVPNISSAPGMIPQDSTCMQGTAGNCHSALSNLKSTLQIFGVPSSRYIIQIRSSVGDTYIL